MARLVLAALLVFHYGADALRLAVEDCADAAWACHCALPPFSTFTDLSAKQKVTLLADEIARFNSDGWPISGGGTTQFHVSPSNTFTHDAEQFFATRPELSVEEVAIRMSDCIEVSELTAKPKPTVFDPLFHTRRATRPSFLFKYWDNIAEEVARAEKLH